MRSEANTPAKEMVELDMPVASEQRVSFLEEDLALSSSAQESLNEKTISESDKTHDETRRSSPDFGKPAMVYMSEDAMDCSYDEPSDASKHEVVVATLDVAKHVAAEQSLNITGHGYAGEQLNISKLIEIEEAPSPELFDSDADDETESTISTFPITISQDPPLTLRSPEKLTQAERILRADRFVRRRINKFLTGVPPPPNHTISQKDCDDFLVFLKQNRRYFWADPFDLDQKLIPGVSELAATLKESNLSTEEKPENTSSSSVNTTISTISTMSTTSTTSELSRVQKAGFRNLSSAFDACEESSKSRFDHNDSSIMDPDFFNQTGSFSLSETLLNNSSFLSTSTFMTGNEDSKLDVSDPTERPPTLYFSTSVEEIKNIQWPAVYGHKCHDIYYNRNRATEDFENLRWKLCERFIGAETQTTCNVWFTRQIPGSARKRSLLLRRMSGQSPGKRLSYLAKRRRTFSSANLQGLVLAEKKQVMLNMNVKKPIFLRKGKSPRGKSPRGKSPRVKTPRSSAKKRMRRYLSENNNPSPRKIKHEFPKRALFQSPERPGPSRLAPSSTVTSNNPMKVRRALLRTPKKNDDDSQSSSYPQSRKRKSEEELENTRNKLPKSLSFDCSRTADNSSNTYSSSRYSTSKTDSSSHGKCELSETHRKKLLWAVAEALRSKGIDSHHAMFKQHATHLARTVRKYMPDLENKYLPRKPGSTSDRMLKLAKRHVILLVESKTVNT